MGCRGAKSCTGCIARDKFGSGILSVLSLEWGLDYILKHFEGQRLFPRTISTKTTEGRQVIVNSTSETLARFRQAGLLDCRISAYPSPSQLSTFVGVNLDLAPSVVMIDLDRETFKTRRAFEMALSRTLKAINYYLKGCEPTVIWSGGGYHINVVFDAFVLEEEDAFHNSKFGSNPSHKFLRFAEWFLSHGRCDPQHNKTVSLRNSMLRIPGSINSKNGKTVRIIQKWNGYRPSIKLLLEDFYVYLWNQRLTVLKEKRSRKLHTEVRTSQHQCVRNSIEWIENLLVTPIVDCRKLTIWRILAPYLLNIRGLSSDDAHVIIGQWLDSCNQLRRLDFNPNHRIRSALNSSKDFLPISREKMKGENGGLYDMLQEKKVFT